MKRFVQTSPDGTTSVIATFTLVGGVVKVAFARRSFQAFYRFDVLRVGGKKLTPADGQRYYDCLEAAFRMSSLGHIETVADDNG